MKERGQRSAKLHPNTYFLHVSRRVLTRQSKKNLSQCHGPHEYGKMIAGFQRFTPNRKDRLPWPLIMRKREGLLSLILGARYAWERAEEGPKALTFQVTWIGFWSISPVHG